MNGITHNLCNHLVLDTAAVACMYAGSFVTGFSPIVGGALVLSQSATLLVMDLTGLSRFQGSENSLKVRYLVNALNATTAVAAAYFTLNFMAPTAIAGTFSAAFCSLETAAIGIGVIAGTTLGTAVAVTAVGISIFACIGLATYLIAPRLMDNIKEKSKQEKADATKPVEEKSEEVPTYSDSENDTRPDEAARIVVLDESEYASEGEANVVQSETPSTEMHNLV